MDKITLILLILTLTSTHAYFWSWFSTDTTAVSNDNKDQTRDVTSSVRQIFAPFEISTNEEKFLMEAQHYLQNLPMLDQCNLLIINRLKSSCNSLSDEELSKLSVNLLNCQSAVEGRALYKCSDDMKLSDCTQGMSGDTWNAYHIVSNRARSICQSVRQAEFRMKTEQTVNHLANAALENINMLNTLSVGQKQLQNVTEESMEKITSHQETVIEQQEALKEQQKSMGTTLQDNMKHLLVEKRLIASRHKQVEEYTQMINDQLTSLINEIKSQDEAKKQGEKEILKDLDSVKTKADEVLQKLESAFVDMDSYHDNIESKQNKTLANLEEIQQAITFMNEVLTKLYSSVDEQLPWLQEMLGGTMDRLTFFTHVIGHMTFFVASFFAILFMNAPTFTRIALLVIVPLNCIVTIQELHHFTYMHMAWLLAVTLPLNFIISLLWNWWNKLWSRDQLKLVNDEKEYQPSPLKLQAVHDLAPLDKPDTLHPMDTFLSSSSTPCKNFEKIETPLDELTLNSTFKSSSPLQRLRTPTSKRKSMNNTSLMDTTVGGSLKCKAQTRTGGRCKNSSLADHETCRVHTPHK